VPDAAIEEFVGTYVTPPPEEGEEDSGPKYEWADLSMGKLRYARRGDKGDAVILLHGFGGDLDNWLFNIDALGEVATVYALDLPGHGQSTKTMAGPSLKAMTAALAEFMKATGIASAHLVGHSMGGAIAMQMAVDSPGKVKSMTLICSAGLGPEIGSYVPGYIAAQGRKDLKPVLETLFADKSLVSRQLVDDVLKYKRLDGVETFLKSLAQSLFGGGTQHDQPGKTIAARAPPTLIIWGSGDQVIPAAHANNLPGAKVHVIDGAGHMVFMEKAGEVNALIKSHIA
jgi:pyruvate dehydrogenase E2 component (dihydrolipoamide acetyltransferase)